MCNELIKAVLISEQVCHLKQKDPQGLLSAKLNEGQEETILKSKQSAHCQEPDNAGQKKTQTNKKKVEQKGANQSGFDPLTDPKHATREQHWGG